MEYERIADKKRARFITSAVQRIVPPGSEILDIGCGNGIISRELGKLGYRVTGIDVSEKTIAAARAANTLSNVQFGVLPAGGLKAQRNRFHAIVCSEVLEHLHTPAGLLDIIHQSLTDNGLLIVTVPNGRGPREMFVTKPVQALQSRNSAPWRLVSTIKRSMGYTGVTVQSSADDLRHIQFFTIRSLSALAAQTGFRITKWSASNFIEQVFPFSLVARRSIFLQKLDCLLADRLPLSMSSGFMTLWEKSHPEK